MGSLIKSFFYKLLHDITFRITAIIGACLAVAMSLIYGLAVKGLTGCGAYQLCTAISPIQNFGISIPINLVISTTLLFSQGIIRNQVIAGNSKAKVYATLLLGGIAFTLSLVFIYVGLSIALTSVFGGFYPTLNGTVLTNYIDGITILKILTIALLAYVLIAVYSIFISTLLRNSGPCIPLTIVPLVFLGAISIVIVTMGQIDKSIIPEWLTKANTIFNPFSSITAMTISSIESTGSEIRVVVDDFEFIANVINSLIYISIFTFVGFVVFKKKDIK